MKYILLCLFFLVNTFALAQVFKVGGIIQLEKAPVEGATISLLPLNIKTVSQADGSFQFYSLKTGTYQVMVTYIGAKQYQQTVTITDQNLSLSITLSLDNTLLNQVIVRDATEQASGNLRQIEGMAIYAGKKTQVINLDNINANLATNNARQVYSRVPGLNIWEYDGGGIQLGIGGRGLNPSRVSNFNTRQNGYDISADALGYPESYYTPPTEAVEKIEIIRGAASLQYGTQFGGLINFQLKKGPDDKPFNFLSRQTGGSFGFFNSFNSLGGTVKKLNYYTYYQYKRGDSWRPNSHFDQHAAYAHIDYEFNQKLIVSAEYTFMHYLAQQPGGLTDNDFQLDPSQSMRERNWFKVNWNLMSLSLDYRFSDQTKINFRSYTLQAGREALGILSYINRPDPGGARDLLVDEYKNYGSEIRLLHRYPLIKGHKSTLLTGVRFYKGLTLRKQGNGDEGAGPQFNFVQKEPNHANYRFPGTNLAGFLENIFQLTEKWNITPGLRMEYISTKADGYYYKVMRFVPNVKTAERIEKNRSFLLLGIGTSYELMKSMEMYANISQNYRSINFNDLRVANENAKVDSLLKDETGYTADGGVRGKLNEWLYYDFSVFYLKYNDRIGSVFTKNEDNLVYRLRTNVADSRNIGFEGLVEVDILKAVRSEKSKYKLSVYTNFAAINARYIHTQETAIRNKQVEFVPPVLIRTGLSFGNKRFNVTYQYAYVAKQYSDATNAVLTPTAVDGVVPAYQVMDISVSYQWKWVGIFGSVNNVGNAKYFTRRADGYPGPGIIPSDPRGYYLTLQVKL